MSVSKKQQQKKTHNAPITTKITSDFTFHICYSCSFSPWYLSIFLYSFFVVLLMAGITTTITTVV